MLKGVSYYLRVSQVGESLQLAVGESFIHFFNHLFNKQMEDLPWGRQRPRDFDEIVLTVKHFDALKK